MGLVFDIACLIILLIVGKAAADEYREGRMVSFWVAVGCMGALMVVWLLFGLGLVWKVL